MDFKVRCTGTNCLNASFTMSTLVSAILMAEKEGYKLTNKKWKCPNCLTTLCSPAVPTVGSESVKHRQKRV